MKLTDFALIFIGVMLPIIIIVYVNISFTIKAQQQEMYFQKIINVAIQDAASQMKEVENTDSNIDYGYSGVEDKKVSVNAQIGVDTFLDSLYNNFGIEGNEAAQEYLQLFVPAITIIDYDGVQVSSIEEYLENGISVKKHALKPKTMYSYSYVVMQRPSGTIEVVNASEPTGLGALVGQVHTVDFSMDDYVVHRGVGCETKAFYLNDTNNNSDLFVGATAHSSKILEHLNKIKGEVIVNTIIREVGYAINANNNFAKSAGIEYSFTFPPMTTEDLNNSIENVGMMAFVQGLSVGNKYLNAKAYGVSKLELVSRFYLSAPSATSKYKMNLYHKDENCPEYKISEKTNMSPRYLTSKQQAAAAKATYKATNEEINGFYPCPICNP